VRYLFRGLVRETGQPVEGHVEGSTEENAYEVLAGNGVVTESLIPDPKPLNLTQELPAAPEFADALESAFDSSSSQVEFDALTERYHGKKVWVIDRDKIRRRVAQVVDAALTLSAQQGEGHGKARERVFNAIQAMFADNRNLATERNASSIAGMKLNDSMAGLRFNAPPTPPPQAAPAAFAAPPMGANGHPGLEQQISRMANLVKQAEAALAAVSAAARRGGGGGGGDGPRRRSIAQPNRTEEQNSVLLEIFKSNLDLVRGMQSGGPAPATVASPEPVPVETASASIPVESFSESTEAVAEAPAQPESEESQA